MDRDSIVERFEKMTGAFDHISGNDRIKGYLMRLIEREKVPQSLLFSGPEECGMGAFSLAFAKLCLKSNRDQHPDIREYRPEGKIGMHSIETLRRLSKEVYFAPFEAEKKFFIIHDAHRMLPTSANALLKTFEEPAPHSIIILISSSPEKFLPTILSRCQMVRFKLDADRDHYKQTLDPALEPIRGYVLDSLARGMFFSYLNVLQITKDLNEHLDSYLKGEEANYRESLEKQYQDTISAVQKQSIEKEIDGVVAMHRVTLARSLFDLILSWFRDLHLLHANADPKLLINPDYSEALTQALQRGEILSLSRVQAAISDAILSLERSTPFQFCVENLFTRLGTSIA